MTISAGLAIYFVLWWIVLFAVLPFGIRSQHEEGGGVEGTDPGAPVIHGMKSKLVWTTLVSTIIFAMGWGAHRAGWFGIDRLSRFLGFS